MDHGFTSIRFNRFKDGEPLGPVQSAPVDIEFSITELTREKVQFSVHEKRIVFVFPEDVLFEFGKDTLKPNAGDTLMRAWALISVIPDR